MGATYPLNITLDDGAYSFLARISDENPNYLDIALQADTDGWVAIGFSQTKLMVGVHITSHI